MPAINVTCAEIQTTDGFEFKLPSDLLKQTLNGDCEQSWNLKDGRLLADPSDPHRLLDPATSVSSDHLTMSQCVDELHHEIICDASRLRFETMFRACNCTDSSSGSTQTRNSGILKLSDLKILIHCSSTAPCPEDDLHHHHHHHSSFSHQTQS